MIVELYPDDALILFHKVCRISDVVNRCKDLATFLDAEKRTHGASTEYI